MDNIQTGVLLKNIVARLDAAIERADNQMPVDIDRTIIEVEDIGLPVAFVDLVALRDDLIYQSGLLLGEDMYLDHHSGAGYGQPSK